MNCLKPPIHIAKRGAVVAVAAVIAAGFLESHGQPANTGSPSSSATVELSPSQLTAIKIEPVRIYRFPVEKEEIGTVSFDEDPATVQAESTLLAAAGTVEVTSNVLERARALYEHNGVSKAELEQDISAAEAGEAALKAARDAVRALGETDEDIDQMIAAGRIEAARGVHTPPKWVLAEVAESDSPLIQVGQPIKVKVTAFSDRVFAGTVSKIYATVDPNSHREAVRCAMDDPQDELRVGMLATVEIEISKPVEATAIPDNGVVHEGDGTLTAWVTTDHSHFTQRVIKTGIREGGEVQVLDGLQPGELAVTDGAILLDNMVNAVPSD